MFEYDDTQFTTSLVTDDLAVYVVLNEFSSESSIVKR